jgi:hypothetical protein
MTYRDAFDQFGKRRIFSKTTGHRVVNVLLTVACIVVWAALTEGWTA